ncbi:MAG: hypothetical protein RBU25_15835 [Lentisphaeria bacterium]|jgi:hypothetical protein|nr:hypothetical protein [Lentisphaeria bacterium]
MFQLGCAERIIEVPLFTELYGYGPFLGRRNRGVRDPLRCRAACFRRGERRVLILANDLVTMSRSAAWAVRRGIVARADIEPEAILVCGSHTHSGPTISHGIGWGELDPGFREGWIRTAFGAGLAAIADEESVSLHIGRSPLREALGVNRVEQDGPTDPDIRWLLARRDSGETKLILHNHGMHGVVFGSAMLLVSADWPGAATQAIVERGLAKHALFLQGAEGNVNTAPCCRNQTEGEPELERIATSYVDSLAAGLASATPMQSTDIGCILRETTFPTKPCTPASLRERANQLREAHPERAYLIQRLEEMALHLEHGGELAVTADLQVLRIGVAAIHSVPGEPFVEVGAEIMRRSPAPFPLVAAIANGNCRYFPTPATFAQHPDILGPGGYGFYEIHQGCGRFMPEYDDHVADFLAEQTTALARECPV